MNQDDVARKLISDLCAEGITNPKILQSVHQKFLMAFAAGYDYRSITRKKPVFQYDKQGVFINKYSSITAAASAIGADVSNLHKVIIHKNKRKSIKGYIFRYANER